MERKTQQFKKSDINNMKMNNKSFQRSEQKTSTMGEKIEMLQQALKQIGDAKRQLCRNTAEAKSRIQCNISRQLETLRNREVWLLNQLDVVSSAKEEVLQQQSARLNQTLGILHSSVQYPDSMSGEKINGLDLSNLQPEETPYVSFKSDPVSLREAIMNYGRIDPNSIPPMQSPFMAPDQAAPSLPRQFEDYNDAEHHILYKTVEEINWKKTNDPCVQVNIPKLSSKLDDWLLYPQTGAAGTCESSITFPQLSDNLSDWLRAPISISKTGSKASTAPVLARDNVTTLEGISTDASIKTWLHKIKQFPYEEEEDYDFIDEISEVRTQCSGDYLDPFTVDLEEKWLQKTNDVTHDQTPLLQIQSLPMDQWLLKSVNGGHKSSSEAVKIDMSRYLTSITDELDKWLLHRVIDKTTEDSGVDDRSSVTEHTRPTVPKSLNLDWHPGRSHVSRIDNPWLQRSRTSTRSGGSMSPASSRSSSFSRLSSVHNTYNKWLLKGGNSDDKDTSAITCPSMDKYKRDIANLSWLKSHKTNSCIASKNPMACFETDFDPSQWLKPQKASVEPLTEKSSPLDKALEFQKSDNSIWLFKSDSSNAAAPAPRCFDKVNVNKDSYWLCSQRSHNIEEDLNEEEIC